MPKFAMAFESSKPKNAKEVRLSRASEALAIKYLEKKRGRAIYEPEKQISKCLAQFERSKQSGNSKSLKALRDNWTNIVGEKLASVCAPETIKGKTLVLRAIGAATPLLQMRTKEILGLSSLACGINLAKLAFIQTKLEAPKNAKTFAPLDANVSNKIEERIEHINSERLKNAIRMLNVAIHNLPK